MQNALEFLRSNRHVDVLPRLFGEYVCAEDVMVIYAYTCLACCCVPSLLAATVLMLLRRNIGALLHEVYLVPGDIKRSPVVCVRVCAFVSEWRAEEYVYIHVHTYKHTYTCMYVVFVCE